MKLKKKVQRRLNITLSALFMFMLLFYTVIPNMGVKAAGQLGVDLHVNDNAGNGISFITENMINSGSDIIVNLTLNNSNSLDWAHDFATTGKGQLVIDGMNADIDTDAWNTYKNTPNNITVSESGDYKTLTITLHKDPNTNYDISNNQTITMNLSPSLVEDWEGTVQPVSFEIYAQPEITMGGSIMNNTTNTDLQKGGKTIDLNLVNATWDTTKIAQLGGLNKILDLFKDSTNTSNDWQVAQYLKQVDPNKYVSFLNGNRTLRFTLPAIPANKITQTDIAFVDQSNVNQITTDDVPNNKYKLINYDQINGADIGSSLSVTGSLGFSIDTTALSVNPNSLTEQTITTSSSAKIVFSLAGNETWNITTADKKKAFIDALVASDQTDQWEMVKNAIKSDLTQVSVNNSNTVLTINIPKVTGYSLTKDQVISFTVPYQVLSANVDLGKQTFTITATPKVLISGSATPTVSQSDYINGGKTVVLTLVNATWANDIATKTTKREALLGDFQWNTDAQTNSSIINQLNAKAQVVRTNDQVVTITLPPFDGIKLSGQVNFIPKTTDNIIDPTTNQNEQLISYNATDTAGNPLTFYTNSIPAFTVNTASNPSASVSGMTNTNEFDIAKGGKTMTITLTNDTWAKDVETTISSNPITLTYSNAQGNSVTLPLPYSSIKRTSDTVVTLILNPVNPFNITKDTAVKLNIPHQLLAISSTDIPVNSAFNILAVTASLSGTGLTLTPADIQKGGKTITVKLNNATFNNYTDPNFINNFITNSFSSTGANWSKVIAALTSDPTKIKATKDTVTLTLPAVPDYPTGPAEAISLIIKQNQNLINNANSDITANNMITVGQVATATSTNSLTESSIQSGTTISITLAGATWDPTLATNKSKLLALLKGFTSSDQANEWAFVSNAIQSSSIPVSIAGNQLTLTIPAVSNYSIIRDQTIDVKIPKSVLTDCNYDISAGQIKITVPIPSTDISLSGLLSGDLAQYIDANGGLNNIQVTVPKKEVQTISVSTMDLPVSGNQNSSVTTIEVTTESDVGKVDVTCKGQNGDITKEQVGATGKYTFVFSNLVKNSDFTVSVYDSNSKKLQEDIYAKITSGSKTYNEEPKTPLDGYYPLYSLLTDKTLLSNIFKYYSTNDIKVGK